MRNRKRMRYQNEIVGMPKAVSRNHIKKKRVFENLVAVSKKFCLTSAHVCGGELTQSMKIALRVKYSALNKRSYNTIM